MAGDPLKGFVTREAPNGVGEKDRRIISQHTVERRANGAEKPGPRHEFRRAFSDEFFNNMHDVRMSDRLPPFNRGQSRICVQAGRERQA